MTRGEGETAVCGHGREIGNTAEVCRPNRIKQPPVSQLKDYICVRTAESGRAQEVSPCSNTAAIELRNGRILSVWTAAENDAS